MQGRNIYHTFEKWFWRKWCQFSKDLSGKKIDKKIVYIRCVFFLIFCLKQLNTLQTGNRKYLFSYGSLCRWKMDSLRESKTRKNRGQVKLSLNKTKLQHSILNEKNLCKNFFLSSFGFRIFLLIRNYQKLSKHTWCHNTLSKGSMKFSEILSLLLWYKLMAKIYMKNYLYVHFIRKIVAKLHLTMGLQSWKPV